MREKGHTAGGGFAGGQRRQRGFSLLEVLVAFTIMALALGTLYQLSGASMGSTAYLERRTYAVIMAESLLARYRSIPPEGVQENGGDADGFQWQLVSAPWERGQPALESEAQPWPFHQLVSRVSWHELGRPREVRLFTLLPERQAQ